MILHIAKIEQDMSRREENHTAPGWLQQEYEGADAAERWRWMGFSLPPPAPLSLPPTLVSAQRLLAHNYYTAQWDTFHISALQRCIDYSSGSGKGWFYLLSSGTMRIRADWDSKHALSDTAPEQGGGVGVMAQWVICAMFKHPWGQESKSELLFKYVQQLNGWQLVKIQWKGMLQTCRYRMSPVKTVRFTHWDGDDKTTACKFGFPCLSASSHLFSVSPQVFGGQGFL